LPIGAAEVTMMEMAGAYAVFANGGKRVQPFAAVDITNSRGEVIYRHDRDAPPPQQIFDPAIVAEMDGMLHQVVEAGTGRRAHLDNTEVAGKTGTTNGYKDAWFIGFTGNYVCTVWYGNDDDTSMKEMTGGTLPAATWHEIMAFAHQGIELKPLPGHTLPAATKPQEQATEAAVADANAADKAANLSRNAADVLGSIASIAKNISAGRTTNAPSLLSFANGGTVAKEGISGIGSVELH
jgi:penicillin-binding protein 1A